MGSTNNFFTKVTKELKSELRLVREHRKQPAMPYMTEKVRSRELARRMDGMPKPERQKLVETMGAETVLRMLRGNNDA